MRIDVTRSKLKAGDLVLKPGFPLIPSSWSERRQAAMRDSLSLVSWYLGGRTVYEMAWESGVTETLIATKIRRGLRFLCDQKWLYAKVPTGRSRPKKSNSEGRGQ